MRLKESNEMRIHNIVYNCVRKALKENVEKNDGKDMAENEKIGKQFIDFIERCNGGVFLQTIVDYETGNEFGEPVSPLPTLIPQFEAAYSIKCTPEMRKEIKRQYNQWWYYAKPQLVEEGYVRRMIKNSVNEALNEIADTHKGLGVVGKVAGKEQ